MKCEKTIILKRICVAWVVRLGIVLLLFGSLASLSHAQDWETPIRLTDDSTLWNASVLVVDDSLNLHLFAVRINDSLRQAGGGTVFHSLYYMKFTNWGLPLNDPIELVHPADPYAETYGPAAVIDSQSRIHVFWGEDDPLSNVSTVYYTQLNPGGELVVPPRALEHSEPIGIFSDSYNAVQAADGNIWINAFDWTIAIAPDGTQLTDAVRYVEPGISVIKPILAASPDSSVWVCFRWGVWPSRISICRVDQQPVEYIDIVRSTPEEPINRGHAGFFIDRNGTRHFILAEEGGEGGSVYYLRLSSDGTERDSVFTSGSEWDPVVTGLSPAPPDTLLHIFTSTQWMTIVGFAIDGSLCRGPELHARGHIGFANRTGLVVKNGGYWLPGGSSDGFGYNHISMLHVAGPEEPLSIAVDYPSLLVTHFSLSTFPNPFNSTLSIALDVPLYQEVSVSLYDLLGREVDVIYRGRLASNSISYAAPAALSSGVYFVRAATSSNTVMQKVVLLK